MRSQVSGRRRRPNPLRRRSDVMATWTLRAAAVLLVVVAPLVGVAAGWWAHDDARTTAREQRADRHPVRAEVVGGTSEAVPTAHGGRQPSAEVTVRWTEPGDGARTAMARVPVGTRAGETVRVWLDSRGRSVAPPADGTAVWQHTVTVGVCATAGAVAVVLLGHAVVRHAAMRRRLGEWERDWARIEPDWTRRRA
ncbi:hypothetical protein [Streptomyces sp. AS02]|uniref:Rv1733c family protein n=1 Tax=Streptomyces sp. AS02 TaxID=2938946 RepID=UPI0020204150|nr:hypothetical protein [Streptomyces sp. AS02]MCL8011565.1 hypothetical protein [Streptomyces sp. AS02]